MAGAASEDDAVSLNVTPLIDIIFCLCLFFLAGFHFKQLAGKLDSYLPKDKGNQGGGATTATMEEIRIIVRLNAAGATEIFYGSNPLGVLNNDKNHDNEIYKDLEGKVKTQYDDYRAQGKNDASVIIDGEPRVPWKHVLWVLDRCKKNNIDKVEFAQPMPTGVNVPK